MNETQPIAPIPSAPRPGFVQVLAALITIGAAAATIGIMLPGLIYWEVCFTAGSVLLIPPALYFLYQQYRSTFRHDSSAAARILAMCVAAASLVLVVTQPLGFAELGSSQSPLVVVAVVLVIDLAVLVVIVSHWRWYHQLRAANAEGYWPAASGSFSLKELLLAFGVLAIVLGIGIPLTKPNEGIRVDPQQTPLGLPSGAREVTYRRTSYAIRYQCHLDEASFLAWQAERDDWEFEPISQASLKFLSEDPATPLALVPHIVQSGWVYHWHVEDQGLTITYDRDEERLFYYSHSR
ncbi:hypothetical protein [Bremerella cremea]|uniref:hypothetical protein n=1 Tax=Bremerella cremea TaxID=1031537 RepID=UPI0031EDC1C9